jgi:hypothetical protein
LYDAKVHDLKGIRRAPASSDDNNATDFMTEKKATTNDFVIVTPYELKFQGFSGELARVLDRLLNAKRCFVVRSIAVDTATDAAAAEAQQQQSSPMSSMMMMMMRYGGRYSMPPQVAAPTPSNAPKRPPGVLLDENKLMIELRVDVVRLKDAPTAARTPVRQVVQNVQ